MQSLETKKARHYLVREINGRPCQLILEGWGGIRTLLDNGNQLRFLSVASKELAEEALESLAA